MSQRLLFIVNPHSGKGLIKNHLLDILDLMVRSGYEVTVYTTQCQEDATRKVIEEAAAYDRIVCSGGDGTLDEVMTGLIESGADIPIGYIPAGSTNDFANSLGIRSPAISVTSTTIRLSMWQRSGCLRRCLTGHPSSSRTFSGMWHISWRV